MEQLAMISPRLSWTIHLASTVVFLVSPARADPLYNVTALTAPEIGQQPWVQGFSNSGQVLFNNPFPAAGATTYSLYDAQAGGTITPLGSPRGGVPQAGSYIPDIMGPNGQIIGWLGAQSVLSSGGQFDPIPAGGQAVNASGQVAYTNGRESSVYSDGVSTSLGTIPGYESTRVSGLNDSGEATGTVYHGSVSQPFFYDGHTPIPLGTFGGQQGYAAGINNRGDVIGVATDAAGNPIGFVSHQGGPLVSLGTLPGSSVSDTRAINDAGQIVGDSGTRAFLYQNGTLTDLNTLLSPSASNLTLVSAQAINDAGQILALGTSKSDGKGQWLLLTPDGLPVPPSPDPLIQMDYGPASVPEPGTLAIFGLMLVGVVARRWASRA
jgi:probable HAF family extracellular repeat protein